MLISSTKKKKAFVHFVTINQSFVASALLRLMFKLAESWSKEQKIRLCERHDKVWPAILTLSSYSVWSSCGSMRGLHLRLLSLQVMARVCLPSTRSPHAHCLLWMSQTLTDTRELTQHRLTALAGRILSDCVLSQSPLRWHDDYHLSHGGSSPAVTAADLLWTQWRTVVQDGRLDCPVCRLWIASGMKTACVSSRSSDWRSQWSMSDRLSCRGKTWKKDKHRWHLLIVTLAAICVCSHYDTRLITSSTFHCHAPSTVKSRQ